MKVSSWKHSSNAHFFLKCRWASVNSPHFLTISSWFTQSPQGEPWGLQGWQALGGFQFATNLQGSTAGKPSGTHWMSDSTDGHPPKRIASFYHWMGPKKKRSDEIYQWLNELYGLWMFMVVITRVHGVYYWVN